MQTKALTKIAGIIIIICIAKLSMGQNVPNVIPPSPNAAALGKYIEAPVSLATGIPSIRIPLYQVQEGALTVPISLSYHAGGIKVEEIASDAGLGWSLNAGGVISRTTRGLPDDHFPEGYIHTANTVKELALKKASSTPSFISELFQMDAGNRDFEPDIFYFNFPGYSGQFFYNQEAGEFMQTPYSNIKVSPEYGTGNKIKSWVFITPDGTKYYFGLIDGETERGVDLNSDPVNFTDGTGLGQISPENGISIPTHISSWHLRKIVSPTNQKIEFFYNKQLEPIEQVNKNQESYYKTYCSSGKYTVLFSRTFSNISLLDSILFTNGKIEFVRDGNNRQDLINSKALKEVNIYQNNSLFKSFKLSHDYFISPETTLNWDNYGNAQTRRYRLKLLSVEEQDAEGNYLPPYSFEYNNTQLPNRFSNAQDFWGYYNGKLNNPNLLPDISSLTSQIGGADRTVDELKAQACMLTRVYYPTGGSTEYFYESNNASSIYSSSTFYTQLEPKSALLTKSSSDIDPTGEYAYVDTFSFGSNIIGNVTVEANTTGCGLSQGNLGLECHYFLKITGISDPTYGLDISSKSCAMDTIALPPGTYKLAATENLGDPPAEDASFFVKVSWNEEIEQTDTTTGVLTKIIGGLRVNKILLHDAKGNTIEKNYNYNYFDNTSSSGYLISTPYYIDLGFVDYTCMTNDGNIYSCPKITSNSQAPLTYANGSAVGYKNVAEYINNKIKTQYTFSYEPGINTLTPNYAFIPQLYKNWKRGNLLQKEEFKLDGGTYKSIQKVENIYTTPGSSTILNFGLKTAPFIPPVGDVEGHAYRPAFYTGKSEWYQLRNTKTTSYFDGKEVIENKEYIYENNPLLASKVKTTKSGGGQFIKTYYYPDDITDNSSLGTEDLLTSSELAAINTLKSDNENRISQPVQSNTYIKKGEKPEVLLTKQRTAYKIWGNIPGSPNNITLPEIVGTAKGTNKLEDRVVYHMYDKKGNPVEVSKAGGKHISYIWGYNYTHPIAKIEGATYSEVVAALSPASIEQLQSMNEASLANELNSLREGLPNALLSTYTYKPLIGMISETAPSGTTIYYNYDSFGRLTNIKDNGKNKLKSYEYNYAYPLIADFECLQEEIIWADLVPFKAKFKFGYNYKWDFGDGTIINTPESNVSHSFNGVGGFTVSLTVSDESGQITETKTIPVFVEKPDFNISIATSVSEYCTEPVLFTSNIEDPTGQNTFTYQWQKKTDEGNWLNEGTGHEGSLGINGGAISVRCLATCRFGTVKVSQVIINTELNKKQYTLTAQASTPNTTETGGTININGSTTINCGDNTSYTINVAPGFHLSEVLVNGVTNFTPVELITGEITRTVENVSENLDIEAVFKQNSISGYITDSGQGIGNIAVKFSHEEYVQDSEGNNTIETHTVIDGSAYTDASGFYNKPVSLDESKIVGNLSGNIVDVEAESNGWTFTPSKKTVTVYAPNTNFNGQRNSYTVTFNTGGTGSGSTNPGTSTTVLHGNELTITANPATNSVFTGWTGDYTGTTNPVNIPITSNRNITANFAIKTVTVNASAGSGGTISSGGTTTLNYGSNKTYTLTPTTGYHVSNVVVNGVSKGAVSSYSFSNITANHTISASFAINTYNITATKGGGSGTISPGGATTVNYGTNKTYYISPATGYNISNVSVDGVSKGSISSFSFNNVTANHNISVYFSIKTYNISSSVGGGSGAISPNGNRIANYGSNKTYTITPSTGYHVTNVIVDGVSKGAISSYTFSNVKANHTISAYFGINKYTISATKSGSGTISPGGNTLVNYGSSKTYTMSPSGGYRIKNVKVNGVSKGAISSYTFSNVKSNKSIYVEFEKLCKITVTENLGYSITPDPIVYVVPGASKTFTVTPMPGYSITNVYVNNVAKGARATYTFTNVQSDKTIRATAQQNNSGGPGGFPGGGL